jgi:hypothetical protein
MKNTRSIVRGERVLEHTPLLQDLGETRLLGQWVSRTLEPCLTEVAHGWRTGHSVDTAIGRIMSLPGSRVAGCDVVSFFTSVRQRHLHRMLMRLPHRTGWRVWDAIEPWLPAQGLPEGNAISPPLANFYLSDRVVDRRWPDALTRYGDNLVLVHDDAETEVLRLRGRLLDLGLLSHQADQQYEIDLVHFCGWTIATQGKGERLQVHRNSKKDTKSAAIAEP